MIRVDSSIADVQKDLKLMTSPSSNLTTFFLIVLASLLITCSSCYKSQIPEIEPITRRMIEEVRKHGYTFLAKKLENIKHEVKSIDINEKDTNLKLGCGTALHYAVMMNYVGVIKALLDRGANMNAQDKDGGAPLHNAAYLSHVEAVKLLINRGASLDIQDNQGITALHIIANTGNQEIAKLLIDKGASKNIKDNRGITPFDIARRRNKAGSHSEVIALLKKKDNS